MDRTSPTSHVVRHAFSSRRIRSAALSLALALGLLGLLVPSAGAAVPHDSTYSGRFTDAVGAALAGPVNLELRIFGAQAGGSALYAESHAGVPLDDEGAFSVQLGGGTNIGQALRYCETLVEDPRRTVLVLVSDFEEGGSPRTLLTITARLASEGVRLLGLAALDEEGTPFFDHGMAERLASVGMEIAAITPRQLGRWLAEVVR